MRILLWTLLLAACAVPGPLGPAPLTPDLPVPRALNDRALTPRATGEPFRFLVAGHLYGDMQQEHYPAATFREALPQLAATGADLLFACGDTFRIGADPWLRDTAAVLAELPLPVFNAPGNHDLTHRETYVGRYGPTWGAFVHGGCLFVQLDTEAEVWEIAGDQLAFLQTALTEAAARPAIRAVFVMAHKLVFTHRRRYLEVLLSGNAFDGIQRPNRFVADVLPHLTALATHKPVYWWSGDIGTARSLPFFLDRDPASGVHFAAVGLGDLPRDLVAVVEVEGADVRVRLLGLGAERPGPLEDYGLDRWRRHRFPDGVPADIETLRAQLPQ